MAFGLLYPRATATRTYRLSQDELAASVDAALQTLAWPHQVLPGHTFQAHVPANGWSWRHQIRVRIHPGGVIEAESKSTYNEILFDLGRNKGNLETFFAFVDHAIRQDADPRPAPGPTPAEPGKPAALLSGCLLTAIILVLLFYFTTYLVFAVVGLVTGHLYLLPVRGAPAITLHGPPARILSALILAACAWFLPRVFKPNARRRKDS